MPEQVFIDLTPGLENVPPETWAGVDPGELRDYMVNRIPEGIDTSEMNLRQLAGAVRVQRVSDSMRASSWLSPRLLEMLDEEYEIDQNRGY